MSRRLRAIAAETVAAVARGGYPTAAGAQVEISGAVAAAVTGTRLYLPDEPLTPSGTPNPSPIVAVTRESTLAAAQRLGWRCRGTS